MCVSCFVLEYPSRSFVHLRPLLRRHAWYGWVLEDATIEELHDVEVGADNALILTKAEGFGYWDVGFLEGVDDAVFAVDFMGCLYDCQIRSDASDLE